MRATSQGTKAPLIAVKANVRRPIRDAFAAFCREKGEIQADTLGRLIEWFVALPEPTRLLVMAKLKGDEALAVARIALERIIAGESRGDADSPAIGASRPKRPSGGTGVGGGAGGTGAA